MENVLLGLRFRAPYYVLFVFLKDHYGACQLIYLVPCGFHFDNTCGPPYEGWHSVEHKDAKDAKIMYEPVQTLAY
jgi:hypothetical protein